MKQVLIIHGGNSFNTYQEYRDYLEAKQLSYDKLVARTNWKHWLATQMPDTDVLLPDMPNPLNAVYDEWVLYFEKLIELLDDDFSLVGHSLGANFLAKYLQDNPLPTKAQKLVLLAAGYNDESNESLGSFVAHSSKNLPASAHEIHLFHSQDDPVAPYTELAKYRQDIPSAIVHDFNDRGHFFTMTPTFPELLEVLR